MEKQYFHSVPLKTPRGCIILKKYIAFNKYSTYSTFNELSDKCFK